MIMNHILLPIHFVLGTSPDPKANPTVDPTTYAHELPLLYDKLGLPNGRWEMRRIVEVLYKRVSYYGSETIINSQGIVG
jgi:hypothetical protein